jgi:hypothetical protein
MSIAATDLSNRLSGGATNSDPLLSLGGAKSSTAALTALFDNVSGDEAASGTVEYRCVYLHNGHASLTLTGAKAWLPANTPSTSTIVEIGVGSSAINGTEQAVANERTAPAGVTFAAALTVDAAVALGDIPPGQHRAVWLRRTVAAGAAALSADSFTLRITGDTL